MRIISDGPTGTLTLNQQKYLEKILAKFSSVNARKTDIPLKRGFQVVY